MRDASDRRTDPGAGDVDILPQYYLASTTNEACYLKASELSPLYWWCLGATHGATHG